MPIDATNPADHQRRIRRGCAVLMSIGCFWFAALALLRPARMAELLRGDTRFVRLLGLRDLASGVALVTARNPVPALVVRVAFDLGDVATFARRRPPIAAVALAYAALGVIALRSGRACR